MTNLNILPDDADDYPHQIVTATNALLLGENRPAFPGHPLCLAVEIMRAFDSYGAASARVSDDTPPAALTSGAVSGAGGNVYAGLDLLKRCIAGHKDLAIDMAQTYWIDTATAFGAARVTAGDEQARVWKTEFEQRLARWTASAPAVASDS